MHQLNVKKGKEARWLIGIPCCANISKYRLNVCTVQHCNMQAGNEFHTQ